MKYFLKNHFKSYRPAVKGILKTLRKQSNIWIDLIAAVGVVFLAFYLKVSKIEGAILILCIALVLSAELVNTAIEVSLNYLAKEHHVDVETAKDIAAGGVLVAAVGAAIIGLLIFLPYIL